MHEKIDAGMQECGASWGICLDADVDLAEAVLALLFVSDAAFRIKNAEK